MNTSFDNDNRLREDLIIGRNAVLEFLKTDKPIECIYIQKGASGSIGKIASMGRERGAVIKEVAAVKLDSLSSHASHQGVILQTSGARYSELEDILAAAGDEPLFIVLADGIEDPHNLGAIIRTAEAAGAHGLIIPKRRSAGLTFAVTKASAGATEHLPVVRVANLAATMETLKKEHNMWFYAADMDGECWRRQDFSGAVGLVIGSEGQGVSRLIREKCDFAVSLPMRGKLGSLHASVAAGIILYEIAARRNNW